MMRCGTWCLQRTFSQYRHVSTHSNSNQTVWQALVTRRTIGDFDTTRKVPNETVQKAVEAAIHAPNHKLTEPWRMVSLGPKASGKLAELCGAHVEKIKGERAGKRKTEKWKAVPNWMVFLSKNQTITPTHTHNTTEPTEMTYTQIEDYAATCCALHNFTLALHESGVVSKWSSGSITRQQVFRDLIEANNDEIIVGLVMFGYPDAKKKKKKPPLKRRGILECLYSVP